MKNMIKKGQLSDLQYDDMKNMLNMSRALTEQVEETNTDRKEESGDEFVERTRKEEKTKEYTISGGKIIVHGRTEMDIELTGEEKSAFQETMDGFIEHVEDLVDFNVLNIYENNIEWSGNLIRFDLEYFYAVGETNGVYINGTMIKVAEDFEEMLGKLKTYYEVFSVKWSQILAQRKTTENQDNEQDDIEN